MIISRFKCELLINTAEEEIVKIFRLVLMSDFT